MCTCLIDVTFHTDVKTTSTTNVCTCACNPMHVCIHACICMFVLRQGSHIDILQILVLMLHVYRYNQSQALLNSSNGFFPVQMPEWMLSRLDVPQQYPAGNMHCMTTNHGINNSWVIGSHCNYDQRLHKVCPLVQGNVCLKSHFAISYK